jgi:hypothetical protein
LVIIDKNTRKVICLAFCNDKKHDFALYKEAGICILGCIRIGADSGFQGIEKIHQNSVTPRKKSKNNPLTEEDKAHNRNLSSERAGNENAIGFIKRFKIIAERYRNRRRRFGLRFTLLAGIYNYEMG